MRTRRQQLVWDKTPAGIVPGNPALHTLWEKGYKAGWGLRSMIARHKQLHTSETTETAIKKFRNHPNRIEATLAVGRTQHRRAPHPHTPTAQELEREGPRIARTNEKEATYQADVMYPLEKAKKQEKIKPSHLNRDKRGVFWDPATDKEYRGILVVCDTLTKRAYCDIVQGNSPSDVYPAFRRIHERVDAWIQKNNLPKFTTLMTDSGTEFEPSGEKVFKSTVPKDEGGSGLTHIYADPKDKYSMHAVERVNKEIRKYCDYLRLLDDGTKKEMTSQHVEQAEMSYNAHPNRWLSQVFGKPTAPDDIQGPQMIRQLVIAAKKEKKKFRKGEYANRLQRYLPATPGQRRFVMFESPQERYGHRKAANAKIYTVVGRIGNRLELAQVKKLRNAPTPFTLDYVKNRAFDPRNINALKTKEFDTWLKA